MKSVREYLMTLLMALSCAAVSIGIVGEVEAIRWEHSMMDRTNRLLATANEQVKGIGADADEVSAEALRAIEDLKVRIRRMRY